MHLSVHHVYLQMPRYGGNFSIQNGEHNMVNMYEKWKSMYHLTIKMKSLFSDIKMTLPFATILNRFKRDILWNKPEMTNMYDITFTGESKKIKH